jgi:hypothetical protein
VHVQPGKQRIPKRVVKLFQLAAGTELDEERLALFEPNGAERRAALAAVASDLRYDEPDMAAALYTRCGRHAFALEQLNFRLSKELAALSRAGGGGPARQRVADAVQALSLRAHELKQGCAPLCSSPLWFSLCRCSLRCPRVLKYRPCPACDAIFT